MSKFKVGDRIRYVNPRSTFVGIQLGDELDVVEGPVHPTYWIVPGKCRSGDILKIYEECFELVKTSEQGPIKSDGGSSAYYDRPIPEWLVGNIVERHKDDGAFIKTEEMIEVLFGNDFDFGTAFKSMVRAYGITQGSGKAGNDLRYETNKIKYYADKINEKGERNV